MKRTYSKCGAPLVSSGWALFPFLCATLLLCGLGAVGATAAHGATAYDAYQIIVTNSEGPVTNFSISHLNPSGECAVMYLDEDSDSYVFGAWSTGVGGGYQELFLVDPHQFPAEWNDNYDFIASAISDDGEVSYCGYDGFENGVETNQDVGYFLYGDVDFQSQKSCTLFLGWNPAGLYSYSLAIDPADAFGGIGTSDPYPYVYGAAVAFEQATEGATNLTTLFFPFVCNNGEESLPAPANPAVPITITSGGFAVWEVDPLEDPSYELLTPTGGIVDLDDYDYTAGMDGFLDGQGDFAFGSLNTGYKVLVSSPLAGLAPGLHSQSEIPGMPANAWSQMFNSSGTFLVTDKDSTIPYDWIISGGVAAPLEEVLPPFVIGDGGVAVSGLTEEGLMTASPWVWDYENDERVPEGVFVLVPTLDCTVATSVPPPYNLGQEFDLVVTVSNLNTIFEITDLVMAGPPGITQSPTTFNILSGPIPAEPLTLEGDGTTTFTYHCVATNAGTSIVVAKIQATGPTGNPLRGYTTTSVQVIQLEDLQLKLCSEPDAAYAGVGVYQSTPSGAQVREVGLINDDDVACFDIQVVNNETTALPVTLMSQETGSVDIPTDYFVGGQDVTEEITSPQGWTTTTLQPGEGLVVSVQMGPSQAAASGDTKAAQVSVTGAGGGTTLDVVLVEAVKAPPVAVTLLAPATAGLTPASLAAGKAPGNLNSPLAFVTDTTALSQLPPVLTGLVADDVTPLLLQLLVSPAQFGNPPGEIYYSLALELTNGGTLGGAPLAERLLVLNNGQWTNSPILGFALGQTNYACLTPVSADDVQLAPGATQMELHVHFTRLDSGADAGEKTIYLSKPPIALVHGYNTTGAWGDDFVSLLQASRPAGFVQTILYGQQPSGASPETLECTVLPLQNLAPMLRDQLESSMSQLTNLWAFTRYDVVAHSQGGVLARMLATAGGNLWVTDPFRNWKNFYRGRFHRVITIGSPHNGSRIVDYVSDLCGNGAFSTQNPIPEALSFLLSDGGVVQTKFDPFAWQIQALNTPGGDWVPDPDAQFQLVQATIDSGGPPSVGNQSLAEILLGLNQTGSQVIPRGYDGVVDFDSMGAYTPEAGQSAQFNVFPMSPSLQIAQASVPAPVGFIPGVGPVCADLFCSDTSETLSTDVAQHVIDALNQNPALPSSALAFGPFTMPALMPSSVQSQIASAGQQIIAAPPNAIGGFVSHHTKAQVSSAYTLVAPSGQNILGSIVWTAERYGAGGITTTGITVQDDSGEGNTNGVIVQYDNSVPGDVVLYASAATDAGTVIVGATVLVASIDPDTNTYSLDSTFISPSSGVYTVGNTIEPQFWATYDGPSGQLVLQRWVSPQTLTGNIYDTAHIMDFSNPLSWMFINTGSTTVWVNWLGQNAPADFIVYDSNVGGTDSDGDGVPDVIEAAVPGRNGQPQGDGNGDGIQDSGQRNVVSLICPSGQWLTLDTMATQNVQFCYTHVVSTPADTRLLPVPYAFDQGFLTLSAFNLNSDGTAVVRIFLPTNVYPDTVWAYGPEPTNSTPHWFQFIYDGVTGAEIQPYIVYLHLLDGRRGDSDGLTNGAINGLVFGLARAITAPPSLEIAVGAPGTAVLTWPAAFPDSANTFLEAANGLGSTNLWQFVPDVPFQSGGQNTLAEPVGVTARFYRLHSQ